MKKSWTRFKRAGREIKLFVITIFLMFLALLWLTLHPYLRLPYSKSTTEIEES